MIAGTDPGTSHEQQVHARRSARCARSAGSAATTATRSSHRSWMKNQGIPHDQFDGRPVIGICNTWSQATPCNAHFRELAAARARRRARRRRLPDRVPGDEPRRDADAPDDDAVPQPGGDGRRGVDPRQSVRRRRAADGLRQDHAGAADGRGVVRPADDRRLRRADAERQVPRRGHRLRHARVEVHRDAEDRRDEARRHASRPSRACRARPATA